MKNGHEKKPDRLKEAKMLPTVEEALDELKTAERLNPGPWIRHSLHVGTAARNIAEKVARLDPEKAYIVGLLHDIGRRVGIVDIPTHIYAGYRYCMDKGWDEAARICMTHSYLRMRDEFDYEPDNEQEKAIKAYIMDCEADDYDKLIQLCDSLAVDYGFVILEKRFVDVTRRYGIMEGYIKGWDTAFAIKEYFEQDMGCSVYDVLPDVGRTSLLTPKPWKPNEPQQGVFSMNDEIIIRKAEKEDVRQIAEILVEDWQKAYRGIIESDYLDALDVDQRYGIELKRYEKLIVAAGADGILGYAWLEPAGDEPADCEVIALYVRYADRNNGIGKRLMRYAFDHFREAGKKKMIIWCLEDNHESRKFYEKMGGQVFRPGTHNWGGREYGMISYLYDLA